MAATQVRFRSISLPSRLPSHNPTKVESCKKTSATSSESLHFGLVELAELYNSVQELTQFSSSHPQSLDLQNHLDGSVELIDCCNNIREMFHMIKENVQSLQSAIRRKGIESSSIQDDISSYLSLRKKMNKNLSKSMKTLKKMEKKELAVSLNVDQDDPIRALREASDVTIATFKAILMYLSCPIAKSKGWSFVSKFMATKSEASSNISSEVEIVDLALDAKVLDGQLVQTSLQDLDSCIEEYESELETLYRQLIRCRVTILNILTDL